MTLQPLLPPPKANPTAASSPAGSGGCRNRGRHAPCPNARPTGGNSLGSLLGGLLVRFLNRRDRVGDALGPGRTGSFPPRWRGDQRCANQCRDRAAQSRCFSPARLGGAALLALGTLTFVAPVEAQSICNAPTLTGRTTIATTTVTVGNFTVRDNTFYGFLVSTQHSFGSLSGDTSFTIGSRSYTIDGAFTTTGGSLDGRLLLSLNRRLTGADRARLQLHVCDATFSLAAARGRLGAPTYNNQFPDSGLDWAGVTSRVLRLSVPTAAVPAAIVSNFDQVNDNFTTTADPLAMRFTTASNSAGYRLSSIAITSNDVESTPFSATLCPTTTNGFPPVAPGQIASHRTCVPLTAPSGFAPGILTFTAPPDSKLAADTTYTVVFLVPSGTANYPTTTSTSEDGMPGGWVLGNRYDVYMGAWQAATVRRALLIAVRGASRNPPSNPSSNATLSGLALSKGMLTPTFSPAQTSYTASVAADVSRITVTPTTDHAGPTDFAGKKIAGATVEYLDGSDRPLTDADTSSADTFEVDLTVGADVIDIIKVKVTAEDGNTTRTYTVAVPREVPASSDATLKSLAVSGGRFDPPFSSAKTGYTATVDDTTSRITVTATPNHADATVEYLDGSDRPLTDADTSSADTFEVDLTVGADVIDIIKVKVTAEDGNTTRTYTVAVPREVPASSDATLKSLAVSGGRFDPPFSSAKTGYTATVDDTTSRITVTATPNHADATVEYLDGSDRPLTDADTSSADTFEVDLTVGADVIDIIKVKVTAEDGNTTRTYTVAVPREVPASSDATLKSLAVSGGRFDPPFSSAKTGYTATVDDTTSRITVTATPNHADATVEYLDGSDRPLTDVDTSSADTFEVDLTQSDTIIRVQVTAGDGNTTKTYLVVVRRRPASTVIEPPPPEPFTGSFSDVPAEHDGTSPFELQFRLSAEPAGLSYRTVQNGLFDVSGGTIGRAWSLQEGNNAGWGLRIEPSAFGDVTLRVRATTDCAGTPGVCTSDGRMLGGGLQVMIAGPPTLAVADAEAEEGSDATLDFAVTLSRALTETVTVEYRTEDDTASAGSDYTNTVGTLTFTAGETSRTVSVPVLYGAHDEGSETMTLRLRNPNPARVKLADAEATGTIDYTDPMPRAWITRFGRTIGGQVVDALTQRLKGGIGTHVTVGGLRLGGAGTLEGEEPLGRTLRLPAWTDRTKLDEATRSMSTEELVLGSAFHLSTGERERGQPTFTAWGRFATGGFETEEDDVTMEGDVTTGLLGADAEWNRLLLGVMVSQSKGDGPYRLSPDKSDDEGTVESTMTGVYPYAKLDLNERVSAWGLVGAGSGDLTLRQKGQDRMETDLGMQMGALGVKGRVLDGSGPSGIGVNVKSDAMWVRTTSDRTQGMESAEGDVNRLRLILEAERQFAMEGGGRFVPSVEVGLRVDGGDAETGTGLELGAGMRYVSGPLTIEGQVRALVAHEASGYEEWGASGAIRVNPSQSGRGLTFAIVPVWGNAGSRTERLWGARDARELGQDAEFEATGRLKAEVGYGIGVPRTRNVVTPYGGLSLAEGSSRRYRAGVRWNLADGAVLGLEGSHEGGANGTAGTNAVEFRAELRW